MKYTTQTSKLLVFLSVLFLFIKQSHAQVTPMGIAVSPPTFEVSSNPGDDISNVIRVQNLSEEPMTVTSETRNFTALGDEGAVGLTDEETGFSLAKWVTVTPVTATIEPKQSFTFAYTIEVPSNAEPGGHFGSVIFRTTAVSNNNTTGTSVAQEVGSLLLVKVSGDVREKLKFDSFVAKQSFYEYGPVDLELKFTNTGNVHVKPTGSVIITDIFGNKVTTIDVETKNVLPGASRRMEAVWKSKLLLGKYTAVATLNYGADKELLTSSTSFTVVPYKLVTGVVVVGSLALYIIFKMRKRLGKALKVLFGK